MWHMNGKLCVVRVFRSRIGGNGGHARLWAIVGRLPAGTEGTIIPIGRAVTMGSLTGQTMVRNYPGSIAGDKRQSAPLRKNATWLGKNASGPAYRLFAFLCRSRLLLRTNATQGTRRDTGKVKSSGRWSSVKDLEPQSSGYTSRATWQMRPTRWSAGDLPCSMGMTSIGEVWSWGRKIN
jgi:hypothetical protein